MPCSREAGAKVAELLSEEGARSSGWRWSSGKAQVMASCGRRDARSLRERTGGALQLAQQSAAGEAAVPWGGAYERAWCLGRGLREGGVVPQGAGPA